MVFSRLTPSDKDAFFGLLDEYFASRPDLFGNASSASAASNRAAATSAVHEALSANNPNPQEVASAVNGWRKANPNAVAEVGSSVGRVAAAAAALRQSQPEGNPIPGFGRPPPRRMPSSSGADEAPPEPEYNKLVPTKKFGDVDMSSGKNMFNSLRNSTANKSATPTPIAPPVASAFPKRNDFAPPPRRVSSNGAATPPAQSAAPPPPVPRRAPSKQEEPEGEWAEALYDYSSSDPGDLNLQEGQRVLVMEHTSDDWWTGEIDGKRGLIPAAYVKML